MLFGKLNSISCRTEAAAGGVIFSSAKSYLDRADQFFRLMDILEEVTFQMRLAHGQKRNDRPGLLRAAVKLQSLLHNAVHLYPGAGHVTA